MIKTYAIDTNVFLHDPRSLLGFEDNLVVMCEKVLRELDEKKKGWGEIPANARETSRQINHLRQEARRLDPRSSLRDGIALPNGGTLRVLMENPGSPIAAQNNDDHTLALLIQNREELPGPIVVVTKDTLMGIKAELLGFDWQDYQRDRTQPNGQGPPTIRLSEEDEIALDCKSGKAGAVNLPGLFKRYQYAKPDGRSQAVTPGYYILPGLAGSRDRLCYISHKEDLRVINQVPILGKTNGGTHREGFNKLKRGLKPRNLEQMAAMDALLHAGKTLVCLLGKSGTGKTLLAIACAVELAEKRKDFRSEPRIQTRHGDLAETVEEEDPPQIIITRPMVSAGPEMGFLPGDIDEKMNPWMRPIHDNLEVLYGVHGTQELLASGKIQLQPIPLIRGRSLNHAILIIDEAQNLTPHEAKLLITRAGQNCRIFMTGDPGQIDNPYVDSSTNGLVYTSHRMGHEPYVAVVHLTQGLRSQLSERATELL